MDQAWLPYGELFEKDASWAMQTSRLTTYSCA